MQVHQALFGEVRNGAHGVLAQSGDGEVVRAAVLRTDLPDQAPPTGFPPVYVSGFSIMGRFILARTAADSTATRAGMVRTHALILDHAELPHALAPLLDRLRQGAPDAESIAAFNYVDDPEAAPTSPLLRPAAAALAAGPRPVVIGGDDEAYEGLIAALWARLTPKLREVFSFRVTFGRRDLQGSNAPDLAWAPPGVASSLSLMPLTPAEPLTPGAALLAGEPDGVRLLDLAAGLELIPSGFADIGRLGAILAQSEEPSVASVANALRMTNSASPDPSRGIVGKAQLTERLVEAVRAAGPAGLAPLRNLSLGGVQLAPLWEAVSDVFADLDPAAPGWPAALSDAVQTGGAVGDWRNAVWRGWSRVTPSAAVMDALLAGFKGQTVALAEVVRRLPVNSAWDEAMSARLAQGAVLAANDAETLRLTLADGPRPRAHAALAARVLPLEIAVDRQLELSGTDGLDLVLAKASPVQRLDLAISQGDSRLVAFAAEAAIKAGRLGARPMAHATVQRIWTMALAKDAEAWKSPADPVAAVRAVLLETAAGRPVAPDLVDRLSLSPLADLSEWPERTLVWPALTAPARDRFLIATADGWLALLAVGPALTGLEPELAAAVAASPRREGLLQAWAADNHPAALRFFELAPELDENEFISWMSAVLNRHSNLEPTVAADIGRLVLQKRWRSSANALLYAWRRGWPQLKTTLDACADLLSPIDRWLYNIRQPTEFELWAIAEDIASDLYPAGPDQGGLWERAGGKHADLIAHGTGRDRWRAALQHMRRGGGVKPGRLVREMLVDFKDNQSLGLLARQAPFKPR